MASKNIARSKSLAPTAAPGLKSIPAGVQGLSSRRALIDTSIRLFCRQGIAATGIDAIVSQSGVARATLYKHFGSKEALVAAVLEEEGAAWRAWFFARVAQVEAAPKARLMAIFDALGEWFAREDYFGCALMTAVAEYRNQNPAILTVTQAHKRPVIEHITAICEAAGARNAQTLASQIDLLMDGAIIKALVSRSPKPAQEAQAVAEALFSVALENRS